MRSSCHVLIHGMMIAHAVALGVILEHSGKQVKTRYRTQQIAVDPDPDDDAVDPTAECDDGKTKEHVVTKDPSRKLQDGVTAADGNWCQQFCVGGRGLGIAKHAGAEAGACYNMGYEHVKTTVTQKFFNGNASNPNYNCDSSVFECPDDEHSYYMDKGDDCFQMCVKKSDRPWNNVLETLTGLDKGSCKNQEDGDNVGMCNYLGNATALLFVDGSVVSGVSLRERIHTLDGGPDGNDGNGPDDRMHSRSGNGPARARASAGDNAQKGADNDDADEAQDGGPEKLLDSAHKSTGVAGDDDAGDSKGGDDDNDDDDDDADAGVAGDGQDDGANGLPHKVHKNTHPLANDDAGESKGSGGNRRPAGQSSSVSKNAKTNDQDDDAADDDKDGAADNDDTSDTKDSQGDVRPDGKSSSVGKKSNKNGQDHDADVDTHGGDDDDDDVEDDDDVAADSQDDSSDASPHKAPKSGSRTNSGLFVRKESH